MKFAILDLRRRHKPGGITGTGGNRLTFVSTDYTYEDGYTVDIPCEDDQSSVDISDILNTLDTSEREVLEMRMNGRYLRKKKDRENFASVCEKLLALI